MYMKHKYAFNVSERFLNLIIRMTTVMAQDLEVTVVASHALLKSVSNINTLLMFQMHSSYRYGTEISV